jgi:Na+-transporting NADH:ubiquinone oxidoreductase subunit A
MSKVIKIRKGLNIPLKGVPQPPVKRTDYAPTYAIKPTAFHGTRPKPLIKKGDKVKAGTALLFDKNNPEILFTSPVSGTIESIQRGERRIIEEVVIIPDEQQVYESFSKGDPATLGKEKIIETLLKSGLWISIRQRPFNVVANPGIQPSAIFISGFDTSPLAPDMNLLIDDKEAFNTGILAINQLTKGDVHLSLNAESPRSEIFEQAPHVKLHFFKGPHPAGNVGIQMHHVNPLIKGETIWTIHPQHVVMIGRLFQHGIVDASKTIALTGSEIKHPGYYKVISGTSIEPLIEGNLVEGDQRFISGNVLTGEKIYKKGHLGFFDTQFTVIPEGRHKKFLGWMAPGIKKHSASGAFLSRLFTKQAYRMDTNLHGGRRAFVVSGEYEKVLPMDIYPVHLLKAILINDIDLMDHLGIHEVVEEDLALCEYICTSKTEVQQILRDGINAMIKENT